MYIYICLPPQNGIFFPLLQSPLMFDPIGPPPTCIGLGSTVFLSLTNDPQKLFCCPLAPPQFIESEGSSPIEGWIFIREDVHPSEQVVCNPYITYESGIFLILPLYMCIYICVYMHMYMYMYVYICVCVCLCRYIYIMHIYMWGGINMVIAHLRFLQLGVLLVGLRLPNILSPPSHVYQLY